jgi:TRAP-type C4-dicarboxylate transport system permease small subunit
VLVVAIVFLWAGIRFTGFGWYRTSELAELPLWTIHIAWPIAGATWLIFLGEQMYDELRTVLGKQSRPGGRSE